MKNILTCAAAIIVSAVATAKPLNYSGCFPQSVKTIGIVGVSSVMDAKKLISGTNALVAAGYRVKVMPNVSETTVASPERRARLFEQAYLDPEIDLLLFARGGRGAIDVIGLIDWNRLKSRDMRVIGFSDVTLVVNTMLAKGIGHPMTGPMLSSMSYSSPATLKRIHDMLAGEPKPVKLVPLNPVSAPVSGTAMGGLLERLHRMATLGTLPRAEGRIVFLENTGKYADSTEAMLDGMLAKGAFTGAKAIVICSFNDKRPKDETAALLRRFADKVGCPVFTGFPYGHVPESSLIDFRRRLTISPKGVLEWEHDAPGGKAGK